MKLYKVTLKYKPDDRLYCPPHTCFVISTDEKHAKKLARIKNQDEWKHYPLSVSEVDMTEEKIIAMLFYHYPY